MLSFSEKGLHVGFKVLDDLEGSRGLGLGVSGKKCSFAA